MRLASSSLSCSSTVIGGSLAQEAFSCLYSPLLAAFPAELGAPFFRRVHFSHCLGPNTSFLPLFPVALSEYPVG